MRAEAYEVSPLPQNQQRIRDKCRHPTGTFSAFMLEAIEQAIPACFEAHVRSYPHRLAVKTSTQELTYEAFNSAANRTAHSILARRGEGAEPVALLFDPNAPLLSAIFGVLKAGKSYVPLEPSLPAARIAAMLEDLQAELMITDGQYCSLAGDLADDRYQLLNIEEIDTSTATANPGQSPAPESLAGIIYTSGSTGRPKDVMQDHRHILHNVMNHTNSFRIGADDRLLVLASSVTAQVMAYIYSALLNGASVYFLDIKKDGLFQVAD
jgi:non-ribosomal peptide synthetase component F